MRVFKFIVLIFLISTILGCSSKNVETNSITKQNIGKTISNNDDEDDELLDEFEDEMEVKKIYDPLSGYNRAMTNFNDGLYTYVLRPVSNGYKKVVHKEIRSSVKKFFHNIMYPLRLVNNLLQGKFKNSTEETGRFIINSTVGIFGLFDPAKSYFGLEKHDEDFGQTLGFYGVSSGPHIVLPIFGPSNLRDTFSMYPDSLANPIDYHDERSYNLTSSTKESIYLKSYKIVNKTSIDGEQYEKMRKDAVDLYSYQRDIYEQYRAKQIEE